MRKYFVMYRLRGLRKCACLLHNLALLSHKLEVLFAKYEGVCEVFVAHNLVLGEFLGRSLEEYLPFEQQVCSVGDAERFLDVVVGDKDAYAALF